MGDGTDRLAAPGCMSVDGGVQGEEFRVGSYEGASSKVLAIWMMVQVRVRILWVVK